MNRDHPSRHFCSIKAHFPATIAISEQTREQWSICSYLSIFCTLHRLRRHERENFLTTKSMRCFPKNIFQYPYPGLSQAFFTIHPIILSSILKFIDLIQKRIQFEEESEKLNKIWQYLIFLLRYFFELSILLCSLRRLLFFTRKSLFI